jgi:hypothetical protein
LTYAQAGERLGMSAEAIRSRARRAGWRTMPDNDGKALVLIPDDATIGVPVRHRRAGGGFPSLPTFLTFPISHRTPAATPAQYFTNPETTRRTQCGISQTNGH